MSVKHTDRELLQALYQFMVSRNFVSINDPAALNDMVKRYKQPPLTKHFRVAMQMTVNDYEYIYGLLTSIHEHLNPPKEQTGEPEPIGDRLDPAAGDLPLDADAQQ